MAALKFVDSARWVETSDVPKLSVIFPEDSAMWGPGFGDLGLMEHNRHHSLSS